MSDELPAPSPMTSTTPPAAGPIGGSIDDALAGRYDFAIGAVLAEAWERTAGSKRVFLAVFAVVSVGVLIVAAVVQLVLFGGFNMQNAGFFRRLAYQLILTAALYPFLVGVIMLGIKRAAGAPIDFAGAFAYLGAAGPVIIAAVLTSLLTSLGFLLLILPGLYLAVAYVFALPLIVEKGLSPWAAMETSRIAVTKRWFKVFGALLVFGVIGAISAFTIVGLIWTIPLWIIGLGVLYRIIFGVETTTLGR